MLQFFIENHKNNSTAAINQLANNRSANRAFVGNAREVLAARTAHAAVAARKCNNRNRLAAADKAEAVGEVAVSFALLGVNA